MGSIGLEAAMSESSTPSDSTPVAHLHSDSFSHKRSADDAGLKTNSVRPTKSVKRRASKACQCCRARKVRCNVVEHGAPCTNCRLDEVECVVSESRRKKKWGTSPPQIGKTAEYKQPASNYPLSAVPPYEPLKKVNEHVPHALYQDLSRPIGGRNSSDSRASIYPPNLLMNLQQQSNGRRAASLSDPNPLMSRLLSAATPSYRLPAYIKPISLSLGPDETMFLEKKGALSIPPTRLRDALLKAYAEFVNPYFPVINLHELVDCIDANGGSQTISLLVFQAVMFAGVAAVDVEQLRAAGYSNRREARREFFQKARYLYDFDYEADRVALIQALLLMTYWYETPDDQKDSHHWMGIAVSFAHTIGLHRTPDKATVMEPARQKLWKRMWWCTYMRDRIIALGMRRPTRIKNADFDVPMLTLDDFDIEARSDQPSCIPAECKVMRDAEMQRQLAVMCIQKAKLCIAMSHVLSVQYSVLHNNHGALSEEGGSTRTTMMLVQNKTEPDIEEVEACDRELQEWRDALAAEAQYLVPGWQDVEAGESSIILNRSLLHMIYYATLSALHRPQVLPATVALSRNPPTEIVDVSRKTVRLAAAEITNIATSLYNLNLVRNLPSTGVTVLLPAIIIHLLDIKAIDDTTRRASLKGFCECMQIIAQLRDIYAAADYSIAFLEAAIRKAEISLPLSKSTSSSSDDNPAVKPNGAPLITSCQGLLDAGRRLQLVSAGPPVYPNTTTATSAAAAIGALTPPPDDSKPPSLARSGSQSLIQPESGALQPHLLDRTHLTDEEISRRLHSYLASTPPDSDPDYDHHHGGNSSVDLDLGDLGDLAFEPELELEPDFAALINLDAAGDWPVEDASANACGVEARQGDADNENAMDLELGWDTGRAMSTGGTGGIRDEGLAMSTQLLTAAE